MKVLSLFDGISCAYEGLNRAGVEVEQYYACEIDKYAIKVSQSNHPDIIRPVNDVRFLSKQMLPEIDMLIGGSPCQDLSIAKKERKGLDGDRSGLFWEYVRILKELKPKYFILENVASMRKEDKAIITEAMGVEPVMFNASLVSAQCRKRLFWTNITFTLPDDKGIVLKDILQPDADVDERMITKDGKAYTLTASYNGAVVKNSIERKQRTMVRLGHIGNSDAQANRVYSPDGKTPTLSANGGGLGAKTGLYAIGRDIGRRLDETGTRKDDDKTIPIQRRIELRDDDKCGTLTSVLKDNLVVSETIIRKLTPIECERLQGLKDDYTSGVSNTQRYKCLGNAFNVDVIAHIIGFLPFL
jgi:DNA (cytosine-5)-methyltransferase 3A